MRERSVPTPNEILEEKSDKNTQDKPINDQNEAHLRAAYVKEVKKYKLLTREEEQDLAKRIKEGDKEAKELLINSNLRLVLKLAHQITTNENIRSDLIQEGNIGLMRAAEDFDPTKNVKFSTYAANWIFSYMKRYTKHNQSLIKIGTTIPQNKIFSNLRRIERELENEGLETSDEMVAERMESSDVTAEGVQSMRQRLKPILSIDTPVSSDEGSNTLGDYLKTPAISPEEATQKSEKINHVREVINSITDEREKTIIKDLLLGDETVESVSKKFGVSRQRAHQIENKVKQKLAKMLKEKGIKDYE